ncbi:MAG: tyrosine-type recombinase/integrase [Desulfuromonadales bacterium]
MASIQERSTKDGKTTYKVVIRLKGHRTETGTFERKTDAKRWAQQTEAAIREGRYFKTREAKKRTVDDLIDRYLRDVLPLKSRIMEKQRFQLLWWKKQIGYLVLADITPAVLAEQRDILYRTKTPSGGRRSPASVNRYMAALSHALTTAATEWGWLDDNPIRRVKKMKESRGRVRFLSDEERSRLLVASMKSSCTYLYPIIVLALSTGARKMEILNLQWKDVDLKRQAIRLLVTKNGEKRNLPLKGLAYDLIKAMSKVRRLDTNLIFPGGNPKRPFEIRKPWVKALEQAGIEDFRFHDLRHTAASYLAMNGATPSEIAEILGHKTLEMVKRYAHLSESHTAHVVDRMNQAMFSGHS